MFKKLFFVFLIKKYKKLTNLSEMFKFFVMF